MNYYRLTGWMMVGIPVGYIIYATHFWSQILLITALVIYVTTALVLIIGGGER